MYVEITQIPPLSARQAALLEAHTLLNLYTVIGWELRNLGRLLAGDPGALRTGLQICDHIGQTIEDRSALRRLVANVAEHESAIMREIDTHLDAAPPAGPVAEALAILRDLFPILQARAAELLLRVSRGDLWETVSIARLEADLRDVFAAMERVSRGRFRVVYTDAAQRERDYHLDLRTEPAGSTSLLLPSSFGDMIRDLVANARKYTPPGGRVQVRIQSSPTGVTLVVEDNGRGIPPAEIDQVVGFGARGSNVDDVRAMGGGFGLTKAFVTTRNLGGRFWIDSMPALGTKIRIWLPAPRSPAQERTQSAELRPPQSPRFPPDQPTAPARESSPIRPG